MSQQRPTLLAATLLASLLAFAGTALSQPAPAAKAPAGAAAPKGTGAAGTQGKAEEPDTLILSDTLHYDDVKKESVFTGNVVMTRGLMKLEADKLTMHEDADGFQYGTATVTGDKLVFVRQENPEKFEVIEAKGKRGEYNGKTNEIEMIDQAVVTRFVCGKPFDSVSGERVIFHQDNNTYEAFGGPNSAARGGRVRSVARPKAKADAALAECQKKSAPTR